MLGILHSATGAWLSKAGRDRKQAILLGAASHAVLDFLGHEEPFDDDGRSRLAVLLPDIGLTGAALLRLGARRGWLSPAFLGAATAIFPDAEIFLLRMSGSYRPWFPSHRYGDLLHSRTRPRLSVQVQFLTGAMLWLLLFRTSGANNP